MDDTKFIIFQVLILSSELNMQFKYGLVLMPQIAEER